jgi:hypothetical protein
MRSMGHDRMLTTGRSPGSVLPTAVMSSVASGLNLLSRDRQGAVFSTGLQPGPRLSQDQEAPATV